MVDSASHQDHQPSPIIFSRKLNRRDHLLHTVTVHLHADYQLTDPLTINRLKLELLGSSPARVLVLAIAV